MDAWTMELTAEDGMRFFLSPKSPVWPWGTMRFLSNGPHGLLLWGVKQPQHIPNQTPQPTAKVKNAWGLSSISPSWCGVSEHEHMHWKHEYIYMHTHKYLHLFNWWRGKTKYYAEYMRKDISREQRQADSPAQFFFSSTKKKSNHCTLWLQEEKYKQVEVKFHQFFTLSLYPPKKWKKKSIPAHKHGAISVLGVTVTTR